MPTPITEKDMRRSRQSLIVFAKSSVPKISKPLLKRAPMAI